MKKLQNEKGFTLVELMIVVAIIGILAAIAIPQFNSYRMRGFNASAMSDLKNAFSSQAAIFTTAQQYGITANTATPATLPATAPAGNAGAFLVGGTANGHFILTTLSDAATLKFEPASVGNGVTLVADTNATPGANTASAFLVFTKHIQGNTTYAMDSDSTSLYQQEITGAAANGCQPAGTAMTAIPTSITTNAVTADDIAGKTGWSVR